MVKLLVLDVEIWIKFDMLLYIGRWIVFKSSSIYENEKDFRNAAANSASSISAKFFNSIKEYDVYYYSQNGGCQSLGNFFSF